MTLEPWHRCACCACVGATQGLMCSRPMVLRIAPYALTDAVAQAKRKATRSTIWSSNIIRHCTHGGCPRCVGGRGPSNPESFGTRSQFTTKPGMTMHMVTHTIIHLVCPFVTHATWWANTFIRMVGHDLATRSGMHSTALCVRSSAIQSPIHPSIHSATHSEPYCLTALCATPIQADGHRNDHHSAAVYV